MKILKLAFVATTFIGLATSQAEEIPHDVQRLLEQRNRAVDKIDATFVKELEKLKIKYTKAADLDSANAIVDLIEKYKVDDGDNLDSAPTTTKWSWGSGGTLVLKADGVATHTSWGDKTGSWEKQSDGSLRLTGGNGLVFKVTFDTEESGKVVNIQGKGQTTITKIP